MCLIFLLELFKQFYNLWIADSLQEGNQKIFQEKYEHITSELFHYVLFYVYIMCYITFVMTFKLNYLKG